MRFVRRLAGGTALVEGAVLAALFVVAAFWGAHYDRASRAANREPFYYQSYFEPAMMLACGHGFRTIVGDRPAAMDAFLAQKADRFDCTELTRDLKTTTENQYQYAWYYLMVTVALAWKILGVTWTGLSPLFGVMFATTVALGYGLLRLAAPWPVALVGAVGLMLSRLHLENLPDLRDYAKAPFVLALILLLLIIVRGRLRGWRLVPVAAVYGAVLGVGYGFRTDLLANIPPFIVAVVGFLPGGLLRNLGVKVAALGVMFAAFLALSWPATHYVVTKGGCQWHVALLGLSHSYDPELGVASSPFEVNTYFGDMFLYTSAMSARNRAAKANAPLVFCSPEYDKVTGAMLRDMVVQFPADLVVRAYASVWKVLDAPFHWYGTPLPGLATRVYDARWTLLKPLEGLGRLAAFAAVLMLAGNSFRLGLFGLFFLAYFAGYPALQFATRHYFHLEFIGWWAASFVVWRAAVAVGLAAGEAPRTAVEWAGFGRRSAVFAGVALLLVFGPLPVLRAYQGHQATRLVQHALGEAREVVPMTPSADGTRLELGESGLPGVNASVDSMETAYLDVHLDAARCPAGVPLGLVYGRAPAGYDFSGPLRLSPATTSAARVLLPVYRGFTGFALGGADPACVTMVERVIDPGSQPLLLQINLPADWQNRPLYETLDLK